MSTPPHAGTCPLLCEARVTPGPAGCAADVAVKVSIAVNAIPTRTLRTTRDPPLFSRAHAPQFRSVFTTIPASAVPLQKSRKKALTIHRNIDLDKK